MSSFRTRGRAWSGPLLHRHVVDGRLPVVILVGTVSFCSRDRRTPSPVYSGSRPRTVSLQCPDGPRGLVVRASVVEEIEKGPGCPTLRPFQRTPFFPSSLPGRNPSTHRTYFFCLFAPTFYPSFSRREPPSPSCSASLFPDRSSDLSYHRLPPGNSGEKVFRRTRDRGPRSRTTLSSGEEREVIRLRRLCPRARQE